VLLQDLSLNNVHSLWKKEGIERKRFMFMKNNALVFLKSTSIAPEPKMEKDVLLF